jgi:class 3 adenylate cyclase/predicted ATPase
LAKPVKPLEIGTWLRGLGLGQYEAAFRDNDVDAEVLPQLTAEDLISIGVTSVGHRRKLLAAIAALGALDVARPPITPIAPADGSPFPFPPPPAEAGRIGAEAERRQLTVMFCDLVGSTALSVALDPEDLREVIAAYHRAVAEVIGNFDGFVAKYMGDGVLVYFGYPRAHEDDAERAVRAGLGIIDAVGRLDVQSIELQARVGIATGLVVVGDLIGEGSAQEQSVVGETPNLAARLQALADPNAVVIAAGTRRLVADLFEYRDLGTVEVKGIAGPVPAWQVLRPSAVASRFEALRGPGLTRLLGRDEEIGLLMRRWDRAKTGHRQVVLISGEPGIGKSRLTAALEERLQVERHFRQRYFCSPYRQDSALYPFIDQIGRAAGFAPADPPAAKLEKLEALLARGSLPDQHVAFLADLLSLPGSERNPLPNLSPQRKKERILEALIVRLESLARRRPVVMIVEDAHWVDPTSRELLDLMVERVRTLSVLLIITFRPEFQPPWSGEPHVAMLVLNRLDRHDRAALVAQIAGKALPDNLVAQIVERTDGVPLFVEELTKSILESALLREEKDHYVHDGPLPALAIPTSLHASLTARLDRLVSVRHVAQIGAAFGRWFRYTSLRAVCSLPEDELQAALARLVASELIFQSGTPPDAVYTFKHALVQVAAYDSLLRNTRQQLHGRIAEALAAHFPELLDSQPELFARHYTEAGLAEKSVFYWSKAARRSTARSAMAEAAAQYQKALDQLKLLPDDFARQRQELEFYAALGAVLQAVKGFAAPETGHAYGRARELWEQLDSPSEFLHIPRGQSVYHAIRGEFDLALRIEEDLLRLSRQRGDPARLVLAHYSSGRTLMFTGRLSSSQTHLQQALALYDTVSHSSLVDQAGVDPYATAQATLGSVLFCLGYPDRAASQSNAAIAEARKIGHQPSLAIALAFGARLSLLLGNDTVLGERAAQLITLSTEQSFASWRALGTIYGGWVKVKNGDVDEGIYLIRSGSTAYRATGAAAWAPLHLGLLAAACEIAGQFEEAATVLDEALQIVERTGERWFAAELNRHKGRLLLRQGNSEAAEELYLKALSIAEEQEAKLWELRAAMSLARLRRHQGRRAEARNLLAPVYGWFTEGFGTPDLKDSKALLAELR